VRISFVPHRGASLKLKWLVGRKSTNAYNVKVIYLTGKRVIVE